MNAQRISRKQYGGNVRIVKASVKAKSTHQVDTGDLKKCKCNLEKGSFSAPSG